MTSITPDIVKPADFDEIRTLLGVDSSVVSDNDIAALPMLHYVEARVKAVVTDWATIVAAASATALTNKVYLKTGVMAWVAARLCGLIMKKEAGGVKIGDYAETGDKLDWPARADELAAMAAEALGCISTRTISRPTYVTFAGPKRRADRGAPEEFEHWLERIRPRLLDWLEEGGEEDDDYWRGT